jgi:hypothetical protein
MRVLDAAANSDPSLVELRNHIAGERQQGLRQGFGTLLEQRGVLRPGLTAQVAGDIIYAVCGQANYEALVTDCGWTESEYRDWLADTLVSTLLVGQDQRNSPASS